FTRTDKKGNSIVIVANFTPVFHPVYRIGLPQAGKIIEVFNSDLEVYAGSNQYNAFVLQAQKEMCNGLPYSVDICVPPLSCIYFKYERIKEKLSKPK
ncbi:MAG: alpha amylase C-terminal domain-containing protein, partial [Eubacteriales bacterium]|nr:alpha amylase C-terminal domain-containing protein [Eubacteriales bacterium]